MSASRTPRIAQAWGLASKLSARDRAPAAGADSPPAPLSHNHGDHHAQAPMHVAKAARVTRPFVDRRAPTFIAQLGFPFLSKLAFTASCRLKIRSAAALAPSSTTGGDQAIDGCAGFAFSRSLSIPRMADFTTSPCDEVIIKAAIAASMIFHWPIASASVLARISASLMDVTMWSISSLFIRLPCLGFGESTEVILFRSIAERGSILGEAAE